MKVVYGYQDANTNHEESKVNADNRKPCGERRDKKKRVRPQKKPKKVPETT
jgi:hypothetical protein